MYQKITFEFGCYFKVLITEARFRVNFGFRVKCKEKNI